MMELKTNYFYGHKVSEYGQEQGYLDYGTLAKAFDAVLCNDIIEKTAAIGYWDIVSGSEFWEDEDGEVHYSDIFQFYIVDHHGAEILQECGEIVYYNDEIGLYVWGVTHWGTSWNYVRTNVRINADN